MRRKILVADDYEMNRKLLCRMLSGEYELLEARNGREAMKILEENFKDISAVLLDIIMPEMDGYEVLTRMRCREELSAIPVIVTTGSAEDSAEIKALSLGANDYILKPYNVEIIRHRLWNTINLRESAAIANLVKRDRLTGLYNREAFFEKASELIAAHEPGYYVMVCFDIDNFKVINDRYGSEKGDEVLKYIGDNFDYGFSLIGGVCCRITADNFAVLYPSRFMETEEISQIRDMAACFDGSIPPITFSVGRYVIDDTSLPISAMYDRASIAENSVKGRFDSCVAFYDESMREHILREQEIRSEMNAALKNGEFELWLQPQYNHSSGALIGAEALVRWRHPKKGIVPPLEFIPVFEGNGFIYEMDKYIWEQSCAFLKKRMDNGCAPLPVSVNISRYDMLREDLTEVLTGLVKKYDIPIGLLRLEVTESAFAEAADQIVNAAKRLIESGFVVEIDDFGSGYSSLNTLKDVPAHVLKLDMRFLEDSDNSSRGGNILQSVVRMARWLGMSVIAEGVETKEQADYLRTIGCDYVQGYLYARPMPVREYEALAKKGGHEEETPFMQNAQEPESDSLWNPSSMATFIFNSCAGGACVFEYHDGSIELLRANGKYAKIVGGKDMSIEDALKLSWREHMDERDYEKLNAAVLHGLNTKEAAVCVALLNGLTAAKESRRLRMTMRLIASTQERHLFYCVNEDITGRNETTG